MDTTAVIGGLVAAIVGLAGVIAKIVIDYRRNYEHQLEIKNKEVAALRDEKNKLEGQLNQLYYEIIQRKLKNGEDSNHRR